MRSVYAKILVWALLTLTISMVLFFFISREIELHMGAGAVFHTTLELELAQTRALYETQGSRAAADFLARVNRSMGWRSFVLDSGNHDVTNGHDRSDLSTLLQNQWDHPVGIPGGIAVGVQSPDHRYAMIVEATFSFDPWTTLPYYALILLTLAALCWPMAYHIYSPLRSLARTFDRFGQGDLSIRERSRRRDEIGDLARSFDRMADRIETLLTAERRLLQDVSHELRSPLARLSFAAALLNTDPDRAKAQLRIGKEVGRLTTLVGSLLEMTRAEGDPASRDIQTVHLDRLVRDVAEDCTVEAAAHSRNLALDIQPDIDVSGDQELLRRAVENVIRNAISYSPEGGTIDVKLSAAAGRAKIEVRDRGQGVPDDQLSQIFQPFFRVDDSRTNSTGGIGLGLAIAMRAVQLHNGTIDAKNVTPGLLVTIELHQANSWQPRSPALLPR
ncbi:MAG TPA: ATP-binding protein [Bryobacteraceae bacterium]|nr:ATP-binding protein [Bryobacteraceae bacterium]